MRFFPQLSSSAVVQLPFSRTEQTRTIISATVSGAEIRREDRGARSRTWKLRMIGLSDSERAGIEQLFEDSKGSLLPFGFLEPGENLLRHSADLTSGSWIAEPGLVLTPGAADPIGAQGATTISNPTTTALSVHQTLSAPGWYAYVGSVYSRAVTGGGLTLSCGPLGDEHSAQDGAAGSWQRTLVASKSQSTVETVMYRMTVPPLSEVVIYGCQLEVGVAASTYKPTESEAGLYADCRFSSDELKLEATGINSHTAEFSLTVTYDVND